MIDFTDLKSDNFFVIKRRSHSNKRIPRLTKSLFVRIISFILKMDSKGGKQFHLREPAPAYNPSEVITFHIRNRIILRRPETL